MKKKILHLKRGWRLGGPENIIFSILELISKDVFDCLCIFHGPWLQKELLEKVDEKNVYFFREKTYSLAIFFKILKYIKKAHILHSHDYKSSFLCYLAKILHPSKKIVISIHGRLKYPLKTRFWEFLEEFFLPFFADAIIVGSYSMRERLLPWIRRDKINVIPNSIITKNLEENKREETRKALGIKKKFLSLTVSQFNKEKGHIHLLRAIPKVLKEMDEIVFVLAGEGPLKEKMHKEAEKLGVLQHLIFTGFYSDIDALYQAADIFVLPSLSESLPLVLLEAIWRGVPCIATDTGDIKRVIEGAKFGKVIPPANSDALASAILDLLGELEKIKKKKEDARAFLQKNYTMDVQIKEVEKVYHSLLCKR